MSSRESILRNIGINKPRDNSPAPQIDFDVTTYDNLSEQAATMIGAVGGQAVELDGVEQVAAKVKEIYPEAKRIVCTVPGCDVSDDDGRAAENPQEFHDVDVAVVPGHFVVAENGAVWVRNPDNRHRGLYFLAEYMVIVVPKEQIVQNMHEAYKLVNFDEPGYGLFISGPSKTADIEQSLVIGAHGPKSAYIFLV